MLEFLKYYFIPSLNNGAAELPNLYQKERKKSAVYYCFDLINNVYCNLSSYVYKKFEHKISIKKPDERVQKIVDTLVQEKEFDTLESLNFIKPDTIEEKKVPSVAKEKKVTVTKEKKKELTKNLVDKIIPILFSSKKIKSAAIEVLPCGGLKILSKKIGQLPRLTSICSDPCIFGKNEIFIPNHQIYLLLNPAIVKEIIQEFPDMQHFLDAWTKPTKDKDKDLDSLIFSDVDSGKTFLMQNGTKTGEYVICKGSESYEYIAFILKDDKAVQRVEFKNPYVVHGRCYMPEYLMLASPLLPPGVSLPENKTKLHNTLLNWKSRSFLKTLKHFSKDADKQNQISHFFSELSWNGCQKEMISWISYFTEKINFFNPLYFLKVFAHHFGLKGSFKDIDLEGFDNKQAQFEILDNIKTYLPNSTLMDNEEKEVVYKAYQRMLFYNKFSENELGKKAKAEAMFKDIENGLPVTIATGWPGHSVNVTLTKSYLIYTNKGSREKGRAGSTIYRIEKPLTPEIIEEILKGGTETFFTQELVEKLELDNIRFHERVDQAVGNCVFASNKSFIKNILMILYFEKNTPYSLFR